MFVGFGLALVAAILPYLIAAACIVAIVWLAMLIAKTWRDHRAATRASSSRAMVAGYRALLPAARFSEVDPDGLTRQVFAAWARTVPETPARHGELVRQVRHTTRLIGRLVTKLDGRRFVWRTGPYLGTEITAQTVPLEVSTLDPYAPPPNLAAASRSVAACGACGGDGKSEHALCAGSGRISCVSCDGVGKVDGVTKAGARRLLNCTACRGKGDNRCNGCTRGRIECTVCARSGRIERWLELEGGTRQEDVQVEPDGSATQAFPWGQDGVSANPAEIAEDARMIATVEALRSLEPSDLADDVPIEWRQAYWAPLAAKLLPNERVVSQSFTLWEIPVAEVTYGLSATRQQTITFEGRRLLAPPPRIDHVFLARAQQLRWFALGVGAVICLLALVYTSRGEYFRTAKLGLLLALVTFGGALAIWATARRTARLRATPLVVAAIATAPIALAAAGAIEPSNRRAATFVARGDLVGAERELSALQSRASSEIWNRIRLEHALRTTDCETAARLSAVLPKGTGEYLRARQHADDLAHGAATQALTDGRIGAVPSILNCMSDSARHADRTRAVEAAQRLAFADRCRASKDWSCALRNVEEALSLGSNEASAHRQTTVAAIADEREQHATKARGERDLRKRIELARVALDLSSLVPPAQPDAFAQMTTMLARDEAKLAADERREAEKRAAAARAAERELVRREAAQALAEARWAQSPLRCNDGTMSPTCRCGRNNGRGCCRGHGGVDGCAAGPSP